MINIQVHEVMHTDITCRWSYIY